MRPFCIATIGAILGIMMGLYLKSIALFAILLFIFSMIFLMIFPLKKKKRVMITLGIFAICFISFLGYTFFKEKQFAQINEKYSKQEVEIQAIVISDRTKKDYKDVYQVQVTSVKEGNKSKKQNFKMILNLKREKDKNIILEYGDEIYFKGIYEQPSKARNEGGFDYSQYLKTKNIVGITTIKSGQVQLVGRNRTFIIAKIIHDIRISAVERIRKILPEDTANLCTGLLLGEKTELSEDIQEDFRNSNLSHMLAISGAHVSYILLGISTAIQKLKLHKRWGKAFLIVFLIFFMILVGGSPSVVRSCIMVILQLLAGILFRKSDTYQNLAISSFIILLINPYTLLDIGFQLSFGGTVGIVILAKRLAAGFSKIAVFTKRLSAVFSKNVAFAKKLSICFYKKDIEDKEQSQVIRIVKKWFKKIKEMSLVTLSANIVILPIMMYHFNTISLTFLISNLLASPILGISIILGMIFLISLLLFPIAKLLSVFLHPILKLLIWIAEFSSKIPFSKVFIPTPKIWQIVIYYIFFLFIFFNKNKTNFIMKYKCILTILLLFLIISPYILGVLPNSKLTISFVDVGQGDCMLIQTPSRKTILIDGGGSETGSFDVGEKTLIPYLLGKGIMQIDYMMFSHFDSDHCQGLISTMEKIKVKNAIISEQGEISKNYKQFLAIAKSKKVKIIKAKAGDKLVMDKQCYLSILFPQKELITTNILNNNSIVAKFVYQINQSKNFTLLLTGDVEAIAEKKLVEEYQNTDILQADVLKVAHHRLKNLFYNRIFESRKT